MKKIICSLIFTACIAHSAEHEVKMISWGNGESMIFDPAVIQIVPGDRVTFIPSQPGHQVNSVVAPENAEKMHSEIDQKYSVTLTEEGIYLYTCLPHQAMNMSGLILIGEPHNREAVATAIDSLEEAAVMNGGRLRSYLNMLDDLHAAEKKPESASSTPKK